MPKKGIGASTIKKNIERESQHYFVKHKTHRFIQRLSDRDERTIGSYLDVLLEREARQHLPAAEVEKIIAESEQVEADRREQAERLLRERQAAGKTEG